MSYKVYQLSLEAGRSVSIWDHNHGRWWKGNLVGESKGFWTRSGGTTNLSNLWMSTDLNFFYYGSTPVGGTGTGTWYKGSDSGNFTWTVAAISDSDSLPGPPEHWARIPVGA